MKLVLGILLSVFTAATAIADEAVTNRRPSKPVDVNVEWDESHFQTKPWINEFRYVLVVNKANKGTDKQTLRIYENGTLINKVKVTTGREQFERKGQNHSKEDFWTVTPTGYYTPNFLSKDHKSSAYGTKFSWITGGTKMPYAIFFNGGIAFHAALSKSIGKLGNRGSGGCIRLHPSVAADLFQRVKETSGSKTPRFTKTGEAIYDENGNLTYSEKSGYSVLVIVQDKIVE